MGMWKEKEVLQQQECEIGPRHCIFSPGMDMLGRKPSTDATAILTHTRASARIGAMSQTQEGNKVAES